MNDLWQLLDDSGIHKSKNNSKSKQASEAVSPIRLQ